MNIRIRSDGTPHNTIITDREGNKVRNVTRIQWDIDSNTSELKLTFAPDKMFISYDGVVMVKLRRWFKTIYVDPFLVGHFIALGYKVVGKGQGVEL